MIFLHAAAPPENCRSERPAHLYAACHAAAHALPAGQMEIVREAAVRRSTVIRELEHRAATMQRRARRVIALKGCSRRTAQLLLPRKSRANLTRCTVPVSVRKAKAHAVRVHRVEIIRVDIGIAPTVGNSRLQSRLM